MDKTWRLLRWSVSKLIAFIDFYNLEGTELETDSPEMIALEAYIHWERRGIGLVPGKH